MNITIIIRLTGEYIHVIDERDVSASITGGLLGQATGALLSFD